MSRTRGGRTRVAIAAKTWPVRDPMPLGHAPTYVRQSSAPNVREASDTAQIAITC